MRKLLLMRRFLAAALAAALLAAPLCGCRKDSVAVSSSAVPVAAAPATPSPTPTATPTPTPEPTPTPTPARDTSPTVLENTAPGTAVIGNALATIDYSNAADGYIMVNYAGSNGKVRLLLDGPDGVQYRYYLHGGWEVFPLSGGAGSYNAGVYEGLGGTQYSLAFSGGFAAAPKDDFSAYLRPNQFVNYTQSSAAVAKSAELAAGAKTDLEVVDRVYNYVIGNVNYDYGEAASVKSGYLPDVDEVLSTCKGICFDYAALMACMLRVQRIPTRLDVGWSGDVYHAWISVYVTDVGWINGIIQFDGSGWKRMDPTFAHNGNQEQWIMDYIANGGNYNTLYTY